MLELFEIYSNCFNICGASVYHDLINFQGLTNSIESLIN